MSDAHGVLPTFEQCYRAVESRDPRFDGWIYVCVVTTGIYCRPSCPAVTPKAVNVRFHPTAAAAQQDGFRACRRCLPDAVPGSPEWGLAYANGRAEVAARAMRMIDDGVVDREGVGGLAARLGYTTRHLSRLLTAELGAGPLGLARARRAHTARILLETTSMPITDVAFAAGFGSVRQFHDTIRAVFASAPGDLRERGRGPRCTTSGSVSLRLPVREPYDAEAVWAYLAARAVPGLEEVDGAIYRRTLRLHHGNGVLELEPRPDHVVVRLTLENLRDLGQASARARRLVHADADPRGVIDALGDDPVLGPLVHKRPGLRVPGTVDAFETAVRTVVGQQVSIAGARTVAGRLVESYGTPLANPVGTLTHTFPTPEALVEAEDLSMPRSRARAIAGLARAVAEEDLVLDSGVDRAETVRRMCALPGIGPWTAEYVALRGLGDPDAFPGTDLGIRQAMQDLVGIKDTAGPAITEYAERWRPLRSYAAQHLWTSLS